MTDKPLKKLLTIFTTCKPFEGEAGVFQDNAIKTWRATRAPILILGNEAGVKERASHSNIRQIEDVEYSDSGVPFLNDIFATAQNATTTPFCCYLNSDIMLLPHTAQQIEKALNSQLCATPFLMTSKRRNIPISQALPDDTEEWSMFLQSLSEAQGSWDSSAAIDMFLFPTGMLMDMPPFMIGRMQWDNWLLWKATNINANVIDASLLLTPLHPIHGYGSDGSSWLTRAQGDDAMANRNLAKGNSLDIEAARTHVLTEERIEVIDHVLTARIEAHCRPDKDREFSAGVSDIAEKMRQFPTQQTLDHFRTLLARHGDFFPQLTEASLSTGEISDLSIALRKAGTLAEKAARLQASLSGPFLNLIHQQTSKGRKVYIWGAGQAGQRLQAFLKTQDIRPSGYVDANPDITNKVVGGLPVSPASMVLTPHTGQKPFILIATMYAQEVAHSLASAGYEEQQDYIG